MPLYEYLCEKGHVTQEIRTVDERAAAACCVRCGGRAEKAILTPPRVFGDFEGYESPATGKWVEGRRAREEDFRVSGCRAYEAGEMEQMQKRQADNERQLDKAVDHAVEASLNELTS